MMTGKEVKLSNREIFSNIIPHFRGGKEENHGYS